MVDITQSFRKIGHEQRSKINVNSHFTNDRTHHFTIHDLKSRFRVSITERSE